MDLGDADAAEPLIGALIAHQPDVDSLQVQARFASMRGDSQKAAELMAQAKELAGERWAEESEAAYRRYQAVLNTSAGKEPGGG